MNNPSTVGAMTFDVAEAPRFYDDLRTAFVTQLRDVNDEQAATSVPSCPGWSVKDVMAHVTGLVAETLANVPLPRGSDEATARQVGDRAGWTLDEVLDEWVSHGEAFVIYGQRDPAYVAALLSDLVVHCHDIREALNLPVAISGAAESKVAERYGEALQDRAADVVKISLAISFLGGSSLNGPVIESADDLRLTVTPFDFLRGVTGRRTRAEVEAFDWSRDPAMLLDSAWSQYGPLTG